MQTTGTYKGKQRAKEIRRSTLAWVRLVVAPGFINDPEKKEFFEWAPKLDPPASPTWWARCEVLSIIYMYLARG